MTNKNTAVGILGGGISGLSTAYGLAQKGIEATVYEKQNQMGGAIQTIQQDGWLVELGPNTVMAKSQLLWDLLDDIGLTNHIVEANDIAQKRFVVKDGCALALPTSLGSFLTTSLLSAGAKLRLLKEPFVARSGQQDESIARFIERRLGRQPLDYGVNPFVSGIFAGDPKALSVKHTFSSLWEMEQQHGSILKGMLKREKSNAQAKRALLSFDNGNQMLPKAFANALPVPVQTSAQITDAKHGQEEWILNGQQNGEKFETRHKYLISTLPTHTLPNIFGTRLFGELADLPYAPLSVVALGFASHQIQHPLDGFGMLVPEVEGYQTLGALFSSTLFPGRAPEGHELLTCFIGGDRNPELAGRPKAELQKIILKEIDEILGIEGEPAFTHHRFWQSAIPQYKVGHDHFVSLMKEIEQQYPSLFLEGNYRGGVSVPDCISSGFETAKRVHEFLQSQ
ncbi:MAG: protoporphyrinogen oxidase [Fodinibius sp.]|nr:protoporphyrinogen oxidase [Fodinibius sp.]